MLKTDLTNQTQSAQSLLCESCGYALGGLGSDGQCPECGVSVAASLPAQRPGSPWQIARGLSAWSDTLQLLLAEPAGLFRLVKISAPASQSLLHANLIAAATIATLAGMGRAWMVILGGAGDLLLWRQTLPLAAVAAWPLVYGGLYLATYVETRGLRFFGSRRGWRVTPDVAWTVCSHASYGWIAAAGLFGVVLVGQPLSGIATPQPVFDFLDNLDALLGLNARLYRWVGRLAMPALASTLGLLLFSIWVYVGVRICRYANTPESTPAAS